MELGPWPKGMNNRAEDYSLPQETCRNAVNIDFGNEGKAKRRNGMKRVFDAINPKGGYRCALGCFFVENMSLKKFDPATKTASTIYQGVSGTTFTYDYFNGEMLFSDGIICLKVTVAGARKWGMDIPPATMAVSTTSGIYGAGVYLAACCWVDANGVESGLSEIVSISAADNSGFAFSSLPITTDPQAVTIRLYLSMPNGNVLYHIADTTASSYTLTLGRYDEGNVCESFGIYPPPPGRIIRRLNGRAYVADAVGRIYYSRPFEPDRFRLEDDYLLFPFPIDIMEPCGNGMFLTYGDETVFFTGDPEADSVPVKKLPYGGIYGTGKKIKNSENVCWQSQKGFVVGSPDGQIANIQEVNVAPHSAQYGSALIREKNGIRQFIASLHQPTVSKMAAKSWIDAEIIRRGA